MWYLRIRSCCLKKWFGLFALENGGTYVETIVCVINGRKYSHFVLKNVPLWSFECMIKLY